MYRNTFWQKTNKKRYWYIQSLNQYYHPAILVHPSDTLAGNFKHSQITQLSSSSPSSSSQSSSSSSSSLSSSIPQPRGSLGLHRWFCNQFSPFSLFSAALWDLPNSRPVHSLMLSSHLFLCLPCLLPPFTVPCKMVLARPDERETWPYHCSLRLSTMVRRSSCSPIAC